MIEARVYRNAAITMLFIVLIFILLFAAKSCSDIRKNDQLIEYYVNKAKRESDSIIQARQKHISLLIHNVFWLKTKVTQAEAKIDSLERIKSKIQYVYITKIKEIDNYNAKQLEKYWRNEFKD